MGSRSGRFEPANLVVQDLERKVDGLEGDGERDHREPQREMSVQDRGTEEHSSVAVNRFDELFVEGVGVAARGAIAEDDDRKIGIGTDLESRALRESLVEVSGEEHLLRERGAKRREPVKEERHPEPQTAEMFRELGGKIGGRELIPRS